MSINSKMTAIADKIRAICGITGVMGLDAMSTNLRTVQANIIDAFTAVSNKGGIVPSSKVSGNLATAINSISDGVKLNFEVVGGTNQPSNPVENTIWVNTSTAISRWAFSSESPSNPISGMVWILIGTSSTVEFNALTDNVGKVYPLSAKQYVSGSWVDKTAKTYQGGVWKEWIEVIDFDLTNWTFKNPYPSRTYTQGAYDLSNKTLKGTITTSYQHVVMLKNEKINCSSDNLLNFVYTLSKDVSSNGALIVKLSYSNNDPTDGNCVVNQQITASGTNKEVNINISSLNSSYYLWIGLVVWGDAGTVNFEVSNLHLK